MFTFPVLTFSCLYNKIDKKDVNAELDKLLN